MEGFRLQRPTRRDDVRPVPAKHGWSVQGLRSHMDFRSSSTLQLRFRQHLGEPEPPWMDSSPRPVATCTALGRT